MGAKRVVIKVGSNTLTTDAGLLDRAYITTLVDQMAALRADGYQIIVVTSAAIAAGSEVLGFCERPHDIPGLQAAAAVGQVALIDAYASALGAHDIACGQVLLTRNDTASRSGYLHARDTLERLLEYGVIPVINENDTVAIDEIKFGDNDTLAALVATMLDASQVVMLTDVDGLYSGDPHGAHPVERYEEITQVDADIMALAGDVGSKWGSGGMFTKLRAARVLLTAGITMTLCDGREPSVLTHAIQEGTGGTIFHAEEPARISQRKRWIATGAAVAGSITVDDGAKRALRRGGVSLLSAGVSGVSGTFKQGQPVAVLDSNGSVIARGLPRYSAEQIKRIAGCHSDEVTRLVPENQGAPVIHCDELVVF